MKKAYREALALAEQQGYLHWPSRGRPNALIGEWDRRCAAAKRPLIYAYGARVHVDLFCVGVRLTPAGDAAACFGLLDMHGRARSRRSKDSGYFGGPVAWSYHHIPLDRVPGLCRDLVSLCRTAITAERLPDEAYRKVCDACLQKRQQATANA